MPRRCCPPASTSPSPATAPSWPRFAPAPRRPASPDRVRFTGRLPSAELHELMRASAVVVAPSRWYENQPMVVLEAFGCASPGRRQRPRRHARARRRTASTGLLVAHDDPAALANALTELATDPVRAHEMGVAAHRSAVDRFAIDRHLERLDQAYATAAITKGGGPPPWGLGSQCSAPAVSRPPSAGVEHHVEEVGRRLVARGHDVTVYSQSKYLGDARVQDHLGMRVVRIAHPAQPRASRPSRTRPCPRSPR